MFRHFFQTCHYLIFRSYCSRLYPNFSTILTTVNVFCFLVFSRHKGGADADQVHRLHFQSIFSARNKNKPSGSIIPALQEERRGIGKKAALPLMEIKTTDVLTHAPREGGGGWMDGDTKRFP